jgi:hypothetical protein
LFITYQQTADFVLHFTFRFPIWEAGRSVNEYRILTFSSILFHWMVAVFLTFASLYRYERLVNLLMFNFRLLTVLKGSREYSILQILRNTSVVLVIINVYLYIHYIAINNKWGIYTLSSRSTELYTILKYGNGVIGVITLMFFGVVDLTASGLMASS